MKKEKKRPSCFSSTLSLAFIICVGAVVAMIFTETKPDTTTFAIIASVISCYMQRGGARYAQKIQDKDKEDDIAMALPGQE